MYIMWGGYPTYLWRLKRCLSGCFRFCLSGRDWWESWFRWNYIRVCWRLTSDWTILTRMSRWRSASIRWSWVHATFWRLTFRWLPLRCWTGRGSSTVVSGAWQRQLLFRPNFVSTTRPSRATGACFPAPLNSAACPGPNWRRVSLGSTPLDGDGRWLECCNPCLPMRRHWYSPIGWWHLLEIILLGMSSSVSFFKIGYWCNFMSEERIFKETIVSHWFEFQRTHHANLLLPEAQAF